MIHVTLDRNHGNWEGAEYLSAEAKDQHDAYVDALNEASQYIDFATYDANRNGVLEPTEAGLLFIVAGYEASGAESTVNLGLPMAAVQHGQGQLRTRRSSTPIRTAKSRSTTTSPWGKPL